MCAGLDNQISLARDEADSTFLAPPLSSQAAITFVGFFFQQNTFVPNSSHMLKCFSAFELCSLFITSKEAVHLLIILSEVSRADKRS